MHPVTRRDFLHTSAFGFAAVTTASWLDLGCGVSPRSGAPDLGARAGDLTLDGGASIAVFPDERATPECNETADNILGPYYREGAPLRGRLVDDRARGVPLRVTGRVISTRCRPLAGALLDVWQANEEGRYDNDGHLGRPALQPFLLRGQIKVASDGSYQLDTIIPGHYLDGAQYRPAHIHVKVTAEGHRPLITQLYFAGDPYNAIDPFIKPSLIMTLHGNGPTSRAARFDFVLAPQLS